jgi:hypothetical protein
LFLLAQLNLNQLPPLEGFPQSGLLQFFIASGDTHGMNLTDLVCGGGHTVLYHPDPPTTPPPGEPNHPDAPRADEAIKDLDLPFLTARPIALTGQAVRDPLSYTDFRFVGLGRELMRSDPAAWPDLAPWLAPGRLAPELAASFDKAFGRSGHRLGGHPFFVGDDPRAMPRYSGFTTLLAQIDSDLSVGLNWGDSGVCNFFIEPDRLAASDFSRVLYHWDCY